MIFFGMWVRLQKFSHCLNLNLKKIVGGRITSGFWFPKFGNPPPRDYTTKPTNERTAHKSYMVLYIKGLIQILLQSVHALITAESSCTANTFVLFEPPWLQFHRISHVWACTKIIQSDLLKTYSEIHVFFSTRRNCQWSSLMWAAFHLCHIEMKCERCINHVDIGHGCCLMQYLQKSNSNERAAAIDISQCIGNWNQSSDAISKKDDGRMHIYKMHWLTERQTDRTCGERDASINEEILHRTAQHIL